MEHSLTGTDNRNAWIRAAGIFFLLITGLVASFWQTAEAIVTTWWDSATFNHCFLILPIVGYLVWERRTIFTRLVPIPSYLGILGMALGGLGWLFGHISDALIIQEVSFAVMIQASVLTVFGRSFTRAMIFPIFFLLFAVPFGDFLIPKLQDITAAIAVWFLKLSGLPVYSDGVFISVPNGDFHVAEACSGVRFLIASIPLGVLFANIAFVSWYRRTMILVLSVVIPIIANGLRAYGIIMIAYLSDNKYALGVDHLVYGWIFFTFVTLVFLSIGSLFMDRPSDMPMLDMKQFPDQRGRHTSTFSQVTVGALALLAANIGASYGAYMEQRVPVGTLAALSAPQVSGTWEKVNEVKTRFPWMPEFKGVDAKILQNYIRDDGASVALYIGFYQYQRRGAELVQFGNKIAAPRPWEWASGEAVTARIDGKLQSSQAVTAVAYNDQRRIWYWYWVDGRYTANQYIAKLLTAKTKLLGARQEAAVIAISVGDVALNESKEAVLQDFLDHLEPVMPGLSKMVHDNAPY